MIAVLEPPAIYLKLVPPPYVELVLPLPRLNVVCREIGGEFDGLLYGCSKWLNGGCLIVIPEQSAEIDQAAVRRHELAHCEGWPKDHPNG